MLPRLLLRFSTVRLFFSVSASLTPSSRSLIVNVIISLVSSVYVLSVVPSDVDSGASLIDVISTVAVAFTALVPSVIV